jgi:hypothetical protein
LATYCQCLSRRLFLGSGLVIGNTGAYFYNALENIVKVAYALAPLTSPDT